MTLPVIWHSGAIRDMREARRWYEREARHVVRQFQVELDLAIDWIATMPNACPPGALGTRLSVLRKFPYVLYFRVTDQHVEILAVAHSKRQADYWHSRLS